MKDIKTIIVFALLIVLPGRSAGEGDVQQKTGVEIYLPREIVVDTNTVRLGQVAVIRGDESLAAAAGNVGLGSFSAPGQKITIDKRTILGRLAASDIAATKVSLQGAEQVTIRQQEQIISGGEFIEKAKLVLKKVPAYSKAVRYYPVGAPADLAVPGGCKGIKLVPRLWPNSTMTLARVEFVVFADEKEIGRRDVTIRIKKAQQNGDEKTASVAKQAEGNAEEQNSPAQLQSGEKAVQVADIPAEGRGGETRADSAASKAPGKVNRNQNVMIKIDSSGLQVSAAGKALQKGSAGDYIKVQNIDSNRVIVAKINEDGSVEPVF